LIKIEGRSDKRDELHEFLVELSRDLPRVNGCEGVLVLRDLESADHYALVETWKSQKFHQNHFDHLQKSGAWATFVTLLAREPLVSTFSLLLPFPPSPFIKLP